MKNRQQKGTNLTPNDMKHPGNKTDGGSAEKDKEDMKRKTAALEQYLEFKDRIISKRKGIIKDMKERQGKNEEVDNKVICEAHTQTHNNIKLSENITDGGAAEMKLLIAVLERSLEEKDHHNQKLNAIIQEMKEQQGSEIIFIERNEETGKCALLRKIRQMREEILSLKKRRTPPTESDDEDDKEKERNDHTGKSEGGAQIIYEEEEDEPRL
jgi:hypothetical protein